jgi:hypothetical protein
MNQEHKIKLKMKMNRSKDQKEAKYPLRIIRKNHPENQIIRDINEGVQTRRKLIKD